MKTRIYKVPFYLIEGGYIDYYTCEHKGIILVKKSIVGNYKEIMTKFDEFYDKSDLYQVFGRSYELKDKKSSIKSDVKKNSFALAIDELELDEDKNLATFSDIEDYERNFDNSPFYNYYKKLHIYDKNEKRKIKEKVKKIEGSRQIL